MTDFTPAQKNAIDARNCNIIVSAAAGSGKTAVIIERLKRMLSDSTNKLPVDKIVVVTFTNDAAAQMKQRLNTAFEGCKTAGGSCRRKNIDGAFLLFCIAP